MDSIVGHGDVGSTSCPGKNLYELLPELKLSMAQDLGYSKKPPTKKPSIEEIKPSYISPTPPAIIRGKKKIINNVDNAVRN
jgi:hypothetical protein